MKYKNILDDDENVMLAAIKNDEANIKLASDRLQNRKEFIVLLIERGVSINILNITNPIFYDDAYIMRAAVIADGRVLEHASDALKDFQPLVNLAVNANWEALKYASPNLKNNENFVLNVVSNNARALQYASLELKKNRKIVLAAVENNGGALKYAPEFKDDEEIVKLALFNNNPALDNYISDRLQKKFHLGNYRSKKPERKLKELPNPFGNNY